jgi:hypothetical protein
VIQEETLLTLKCLKQCREALVSSFLHEDEAIFGPMFEFENESFLMELSIEGFFIDWINQHFPLFQALHKDFSEIPEASRETFISLILTLVQDHIKCSGPMLTSESRDFILSILEDKKRALTSLLDLSKNSEKSYQKLLYWQKKDRALFQRKITSLKAGS